MMLHYHTRGEPYARYEPDHAQSGAVKSQREGLMVWELLETDGGSPSGYRVTERGRAFVEAICAMPLPIKKWVMPDAA